MNELSQKLRYEGIVEALDLLLADIAVRIQLSPSDYKKAVERYATLEAWLNRDGSALEGLVEIFYGQGSIATGSTIARHSEREEFDVDAMVQLAISRWADPEEVLDLLYETIRGEPGSRYYNMTKRRTRCVTVEYEDGMHVDLTPAVRLPERNERTSHIFHSPQNPPEPKAHFVANPHGFAIHFNASTPVDADFGRFFEQRTLAMEHAKAQVLADAEPVPDQVPAYRKSRALISLQLIKRRRNIAYEKRRNVKRPPSILLAKWVADHANHTRTLAEELQHQVDCMIAVISGAQVTGKLVHETNPACSPDDVLTDRWPCSLAEQRMFLEDLRDFAAKIRRLREPISMKERQEILVELFGERPARDAVKSYFEEEGRRGDAGTSTHVPGLGRVAVVAAPAVIAAEVVRATPRNTFFGD